MADGILKTIIQLKNDTTENWSTNNPVLTKGEPGVEFTTDGKRKVKIGDGTTAWNDLDYLSDDAASSVLAADGKTIDSVNGSLVLHGFGTATVGQVPVIVNTGTDEAPVLALGWQTLGGALVDTYTKQQIDTKLSGLKSEVDAKLASVYNVKGSVASLEALEATVTDGTYTPAVGDVWNIETAGGTDIHGNKVGAGANVVFVSTGEGETATTGWDVLGFSVDTSGFLTKQDIATDTDAGVVKSSSDAGKVKVNEDGTMTVNSLSVDKLYQDENTFLVLNGGDSTVPTVAE